MKTLLLDPSDWDLTIDAAGNIACASDPYSQGQDAASAAKLFKSELWFDTLPGVPYWASILGHLPPLSLIKAEMVRAARTVPGVESAVCYITSFANRQISGQIQIKTSSGLSSTADF